MLDLDLAALFVLIYLGGDIQSMCLYYHLSFLYASSLMLYLAFCKSQFSFTL